MNKLLTAALLSIIALGLIGCKAVLPKPESNDDTLILAPFSAEKSGISSVWSYHYVLNDNLDTLISIYPKEVRGNYSIQTGIPEGEYAITAIKSVPRSKGRTRAIGEGRISQIPANDQILFEVRKNKITILPLKIIFTKGRTTPSGVTYSGLDFKVLDKEALAQEEKEVQKIEGIENWKIYTP